MSSEAVAAGEEVIGLNIRSEANSRSSKLGIVPRGCRLQLGERSADGKWARIKNISGGQPAPVKQGGSVDPLASSGWVFIGELDPAPAKPATEGQVVVLEKPVPIRAGDRVGYPGEYQELEEASAAVQRGKSQMLHMEVFAGPDVPTFVAAARSHSESLPKASKSLLLIDKGCQLVQPAPPTQTTTAGQALLEQSDSPATGQWARARVATVQIMARTALGAYTSKSKMYTGGQKWTGWYVGAKDSQRTQSESEATRLGYLRREVLVPQGQPVWVERSALAEHGARPVPVWDVCPLQVTRAAAPAAAFPQVLSQAALASAKTGEAAVDDKSKRWWRVGVRVERGGAGTAATHTGWVCEEGQANVRWASDWDFPGFEFVEEDQVGPVDLCAAGLQGAGRACAEESKDFKARADKVDASALVQRLYQQIDADGNGNFDASELASAMQQPLLAQALSRLVARYESEWGGEASKWDELDSLMRDDLPLWQAEKVRIAKLQWWNDVAGKVEGFPTAPEVYHFHPIGLVGNFYQPPRQETVSSVGPQTLEKSGRQWVSRFMPSRNVSDLREPFRTNVTSFLAALRAAGVTVTINTTLRPPQRSYLM